MQVEKVLIETTLKKHFAQSIQINNVIEHEDGAQGMSGNEVRYFSVQFQDGRAEDSAEIVIKNTNLAERKTHLHLSNLGLPVPFAHADDTTTDANAPLCMQQLSQKQPQHVDVEKSAMALAQIHYANLGKQADLDWLPAADLAFVNEWLVEACWRQGWQSIMNGGGLIDGYGNNHGTPKEGGDFSAEFQPYTAQIEAVGSALHNTMQQWWADNNALTLIHADLHGDHTYTDDEKTYIIDWGAARYGPLYLDLPNYFTRDESLVYRDALAQLGHDIPKDEFLAGYDAATVYPGFKYFGIGLWNWCYGDPPHQTESVLHFINMILNPNKV